MIFGGTSWSGKLIVTCSSPRHHCELARCEDWPHVPEPLFEVEPTLTNDVMVLSARGELDAFTAPRLNRAIFSALAEPSTAIIVDFSQLAFLASAGMGVLLRACRSADSKPFGVVADGPRIGRPMKLLGLERELSVYPTLDAALANISQGRRRLGSSTNGQTGLL